MLCVHRHGSVCVCVWRFDEIANKAVKRNAQNGIFAEIAWRVRAMIPRQLSSNSIRYVFYFIRFEYENECKNVFPICLLDSFNQFVPVHAHIIHPMLVFFSNRSNFCRALFYPFASLNFFKKYPLSLPISCICLYTSFYSFLCFTLNTFLWSISCFPQPSIYFHLVRKFLSVFVSCSIFVVIFSSHLVRLINYMNIICAIHTNSHTSQQLRSIL